MHADDNGPAPGEAELDQAADWIDRLDELTPSDQQALKTWLNASSANTRAFDLMRRTVLDPALVLAAERVRSVEAAAPADSPNVVRLQATTRPARGVSSLRLGLIAASVAGLLAIGGALTLLPTARPPEAPTVLTTAVGAPSDYGLSDKSVVHLNADSRLNVRYSRASRDLALEKGDAMFEVAKNPDRPFNVTAGGATVTAVGTRFEVDRVSDAVEVHVFEGVVKVSGQDGPTRLVRKGEWVLLAADRQSSGRFEPDSYQTWRSDWLVAEQTPLKYVIARLNRYSAGQILVRDPAIGNLKVTGRFRLSRPGDALAMISALLNVETVRSGQGVDLAPRPAGAGTGRAPS